MTTSEPGAAPSTAGSAATVPPPPASVAPVQGGDASTATSSVPATETTRRHGREDTPSRGRGVLVVPGLLVLALVLLVVGLLRSSSVWLAASLVASVLAAALLVVERLVQRRRATRAATAPASDTPGRTGDPAGSDAATEVVDLEAPAIDPDDPAAVWVVDGRPRYHARDCETLQSLPAEAIAREQALEDGFVACSLCEPGTTEGAAHAR